jgi:signal transduction histidine kinase
MAIKIAGRRGGVASKLVEPYFQIKLGLMFVIVNLLFSAMIAAVMYWVVSDIFVAIKTYFTLIGNDAAFTQEKLRTPLLLIVGMILTFIVVTFYIAIHYTHKIYGPLVSINRFVDDMVDGKAPRRLTLRDGDELTELVTKLNILADKFKA